MLRLADFQVGVEFHRPQPVRSTHHGRAVRHEFSLEHFQLLRRHFFDHIRDVLARRVPVQIQHFKKFPVMDSGNNARINFAHQLYPVHNGFLSLQEFWFRIAIGHSR